MKELRLFYKKRLCLIMKALKDKVMVKVIWLIEVVKKILNIKYTPDFVADTFIIECKGRANESFPIRWKMFKKYVKENLPHVTLYKPQNQKECDKVIELINERNK